MNSATREADRRRASARLARSRFFRQYMSQDDISTDKQIDSAHSDELNDVMETETEEDDAACALLAMQDSKRLKTITTQTSNALGETGSVSRIPSSEVERDKNTTNEAFNPTNQTKTRGPNTSLRYPLSEKGHCKVLIQLHPNRKNPKKGETS